MAVPAWVFVCPCRFVYRYEMAHTISRTFPHKSRQLRWLIAVNVIILLAGLFSPMLTLEKFIFVENTFSLVSGVWQLLREGKWLLFLILLAFSILLPVLKLIVLYQLVAPRAVRPGRYRRYLELMHEYGRWSMLDVFVVAVLIVAVKLDVLFEVQVHFGLYAFAAAVLLTMIITAQVVRLSDACLEKAGVS
ncbi:paraquat-inducible protein A [Sulfuriflexus sp.]|uniref:paraquat-inducible protein A n=1 Tax=Sulfuriflexus sp. TaxID=2015443 RepID=UPI0028CDE415|nr:paraquat-inducible protein A [Sulfuriflexus sp.]MDT8404369.1 paraquat-inducible protein A [Sulfuriflexus sp.]